MSIFGSSLIPAKDLDNFCTNKEGYATALKPCFYTQGIALYNAKTVGRFVEENSSEL